MKAIFTLLRTRKFEVIVFWRTFHRPFIYKVVAKGKWFPLLELNQYFKSQNLVYYLYTKRNYKWLVRVQPLITIVKEKESYHAIAMPIASSKIKA